MKQANITYTEKDGILYPDLRLPNTAQKPFGKYGHMRLEYLRKHRRGTYATLLTEGKLNEHLCQIDTEAREMVRQMYEDLSKQNGIDEDLKSRDPMKWVQEMNNIKASAEEIALCEIVYN